MESICLESSRLILRTPRPGDKDFFIQLYANARVMAHIPPRGKPERREGALRRFKALTEHWEKHGYGMFVLELKTGKEQVGYCGLRFLEAAGAVELGYIIDEPHWGKGMAPEAARRCVEFARTDVKAEEVVSMTHPGNEASQAILTRLGFVRCQERDGIYHGMAHDFFVLPLK